MRAGLRLCFLLVLASAGLDAAPARAPHLRQHPSNPHYFEFRGQPTILVTSAEHYGAVLNLDFDYIPYLNELASKGLNNTRIFSGFYVEAQGAFGIQKNTLAPAAGRFITPWARSSTPGYRNGGNKFNLDAWDAAYFARLRDFCAQAGQRNIIVEVNLFCPFYDDNLWTYSPLHANNNVNGVGAIGKDSVYNLSNAAMTARQEAMVRKFVAELRDYDNVYYEITNEPYAGAVTTAFQHRMVDVIVAAESGFTNKHLISLNIANGSQTVTNPHPNVSILNFHYADPPNAVAANYGLGRIIGENETGFDGSSDYEYRKEGWHFIVAGGALYNNLDYSFTAALENGTDTQSAPGGGGPALRSQLKILKDFIHGFNFLAMSPNNGVIQGGVPSGATARCLAQTGEQYALYMSGGSQASLVLNLPGATYQADWVDTKNGAIAKTETFAHGGGSRTLASPSYSQDIALRVRRMSGGTPAHPPENATFYRAINLNGPALTIDGNAWEGSTAPNYSFTGSAFANQGVVLSPPTDANRATMIRSSVWNPGGSNVAMSGVPAGRYVVYLYVWEDNVPVTFNVSLEGSVVQSGYSSGVGGHWDRLGPWTRDISDGTINISCSAGDANLSGLEVWREGSTPSATVSVTASDASAGEPSNPGAFTFTRTGSTSAALTLGYTVGGSATSGADYQALSGSVTIPAGSASASVPVNVINDSISESSETVTVSIPGSSAAVTIADDDVPPPTTGDLLVHLQFDAGGGTVATDSSGTGNPGELRGGAGWAAGKSGSSVSLDGADDHVRVASSASLNAATTALTVAAWVYRTSNQSGWRVVATRQFGSGFDDVYTLGFLDNAYRFGAHTTSSYPMLSGGAAPLDTWVHMAGTYDGSIVRLYVNGVQAASSAAGGPLVSDAKPLVVGAGQNDGTSNVREALAGRIDDLRVYKRALSAAEIQALAVPPRPSSGLVLHWPLDGDAQDASGNGNHGTVSGAVFTAGNLGGGLDVDGDHLSAPNSTSINTLGGQMTVALWIYKRADAPNYGSVIGRRKGTGFEDLWILYYNNSANDEVSAGLSTSAGTAHLIGPSSAGDLNRWVHLALAYDGSTMRLYRDGVEIASRGHTGSILSETTPLVLGAGDNGGAISEHVNGILDDVRLYNRALPAAEIQGLFNLGGGVAKAALAFEEAPPATGGGDGTCGLLGLEVLLLAVTLRRRSNVSSGGGNRGDGACAGRR